VNVGNPAEMTVRQFAEAIIKATGSRSQIVSKPLPVDDPKQRRPDITRARQLLGWEPQVNLDDGLRRTIPYFRERLAMPAVS
jgi:dTDP-glucose 4,6-dehydratase